MTGHSKTKPWRVYRQDAETRYADIEVCTHRWGWTAELCAGRRETSRSHRAQWGIFYTARRVTS